MKYPCATDRLRTALKEADLSQYGAIPFWSWNNELEIEELLNQIDAMKEVGMGGFIMHARIGLKTEYLGEKWFSCIEACLGRARELGMHAWIYDENGWPSGFVGGKLLEREDFRAQFLEYAVKDFFDPEAFAVYRQTATGFARLEGEAPELVEYHCVYLRTSPANTDILNPEVIDAFIEETHEQYYKRFPESFGRELSGFFTDEPQCYRAQTAYSRFIREVYEAEYGADIRDGLVYLFFTFPEGYLFRERYYTIMNRLYTERFYKRIYDWCDEHNCMLTGHSIEEGGIYGQFLGGAGVMSTYEYQHIPGIDWLGRRSGSELAPKQIGSVASQLGIHHVLTETFACGGHDTTPRELKSIGDFQFFGGVNLACYHLYPYSMSAQGKSDHPPIFSPQNNWWEEFKTFNDYFTRLGFLVANTKETYDVLVIHPMRAAYLDYLRGNRNNKLEADFDQLLSFFRQNGIRFQLADEGQLARHGKVNGDSLQVGKCSYRTVVVPDMKTVSATTVELLKQYTGRLLMMGKPTLIDGAPGEVPPASNMTREELIEAAGIRFRSDGRVGITSRESELGDFIFVKNYSLDEEGSFETKGIAVRYSALDLESFALSPINDQMILRPGEDLILIRDENAQSLHPTYREDDITSAFTASAVTENALIVDTAAISKNGAPYGEVLPLQRIFEDLLREDWCGRLRVRQTFTVKDRLPLSLLIEAGAYHEVTCNGTALSLSVHPYDPLFRKADLSGLVREGENAIEYELDYYQHEGVHFALFDPLATESLRNCLYYDTHLESIYLEGDFIVDSEHRICKRTTPPPVTRNLHLHGYPFFKGSVTFSGEYDYDGIGRRILSLTGRFMTAAIRINGVSTSMVLDDRRDITALLVPGNNKIEITLRSGLRNFFGPHHFAPDPEPHGVSPFNFTLRGSWNGGISPSYTPLYHSVPFGLDRIEMLGENT